MSILVTLKEEMVDCLSQSVDTVGAGWGVSTSDMVMSLVPWYGFICFYFCISSISALTLTYYNAWY